MLTEQQLENRRQGIGGSDGAVIAGVSTRKQPLQLYYEKRGELPPDDLSGLENVHFGNLLEDVIAAEAARRMEVKLRRVNTTLSHPELPFVLGHIDRDIMGTPWIMECKNVGFKSMDWGPEGSDQVPEEHLIQSQHYLALKPKKALVKLAALFTGNHLRIYEIPRDREMIAMLLDLYTEFWDRVENGIPPNIDYAHPTTGELLQRLYPGTNGEVIDLPESLLRWHHTAQEAAELEKQYRQVKTTAYSHIQRLMGEASVGLLPGGMGYTRKQVTRKGYTVEATQYIDFRFSKHPKGAKKK
jgi:putative phage-type endonuclease